MLDVGKIIEKKIRFTFRQPRPRPGAGRDRDGTGAECFPAGNVVARIANHIDLARKEFRSVTLLDTGQCKPAKLIAIVMIIGESAEHEKVPEFIVLQL